MGGTASSIPLTTRERKLPSSPLATVNAKLFPDSRPLQNLTRAEIGKRFERALAKADGVTGA
ncbi:MAG: hypothetical protein JWN43_3265, partial [Gammaproteobacteria bacterium]|nr:hypothetical protein [Gammaproteobacteria bacterium]